MKNYTMITFLILLLIAPINLFALNLKDLEKDISVPPELVEKMLQFEKCMNNQSTLKLQLLAHPEIKSEKDLTSGPVKHAKSLDHYFSINHTKFLLESVKLRKNGKLGNEWVSFYACIDLKTEKKLEKKVATTWIESKNLGWYWTAISL